MRGCLTSDLWRHELNPIADTACRNIRSTALLSGPLTQSSPPEGERAILLRDTPRLRVNILSFFLDGVASSYAVKRGHDGLELILIRSKPLYETKRAARAALLLRPRSPDVSGCYPCPEAQRRDRSARRSSNPRSSRTVAGIAGRRRCCRRHSSSPRPGCCSR